MLQLAKFIHIYNSWSNHPVNQIFKDVLNFP